MLSGFYVITQDAVDEAAQQVKQTLLKSGLINLQSTRAFNKITDGQFKPSVTSAVTALRNRQEEKREQRKQYNARPDVKQRMREYNQSPEVKERKRKDRELKRKMLKKIPREVVLQVLKEEEISKAEKSSE
jgi:ribosomal protein L20